MSVLRSILIVIALVLASTAPIAAKTYRWVDEHGTVHYTDQPPPKKSAPLPDPAPAPQRQDPSASPTMAPAPQAPQAPTQTAPTSRTPRSAPAPTAPAPPPPAPQTTPAPAGPAPSAVAPERRDEATALALELIELSGMDRSLEHLAEIARQTAYTKIWRRRDVQRTWSTLMPLLRRDVLAKPATACVARHLGAGPSTEMMAWVRSPLGAKIQKLEAELASSGGRQEYRKFVIGLPDTKIQPARLEIVQRMEERSRMAERQSELEASMRAAMGRVLGQGQSDEDNDDDESRDRLATNEHNRFWAVTAMLFAYHNLTEAELQTYDRFDASPTGVWFTNTYWGCLRETVKATEQRLTEALKSRRTAGRAAPAAR
jgi:hypothetical protein